jgi:hypothetical protein
LVDTSASSDRRLDGDPARKPRPRPGKLSGGVVSPKSVVDASADRRLDGGGADSPESSADATANHELHEKD